MKLIPFLLSFLLSSASIILLLAVGPKGEERIVEVRIFDGFTPAKDAQKFILKRSKQGYHLIELEPIQNGSSSKSDIIVGMEK